MKNPIPIFHSRHIFPSLVSCSALLIGLGQTEGATITMVATNTSGQHWNTPGAWSNNAAPSAANNYVVGTSATNVPFTVRAPGTDSTFGGNSLTLSGGQLNLTSGINTIPDLRVENGGVILSPLQDQNRALNGGLTFLGGTNVIRTAGSTAANARHITINSTVAGSGTVRVLQHGSITLTNAANTFGGTWHVGGTASYNSDSGLASFSNTATTRTTLHANAPAGAGSLGVNSNVILDLYSILNINYDWVTGGSMTFIVNDTADANAVRMNLTHNHTVGALTIAGDSLEAGVYDYDRLVAEGFGNYFGSGSGSITVIPEPTGASLVGLGLLLALTRRTRRD